jgi:DNA-binding XRE family transcriptional regulator
MFSPNRLRVIRAGLGWTKSRAARYCRVSRQTFGDWENGRKPNPDHRLKLEALERLYIRKTLPAAVERMVEAVAETKFPPCGNHFSENRTPVEPGPHATPPVGPWTLVEEPNHAPLPESSLPVAILSAADDAAPGPGPDGPGLGKGL